MGTLWQTLKRVVWTYSMMLGSDETGPANVFSYAVNACQSENVRDVFLRLLKWCGRLMLAGLGLSCLVFSATCIYAGLYYLIMPTRIIQQTLYFDYGAHPAVPRSPVVIYPHEDRAHLPTATVSFLTSNIQWHYAPVYSSGSVHHEEAEKEEAETETTLTNNRVLMPSTAYDILIQLSVPISPTNVDVGMVMINTTLETQDREILATSARPALVIEPNWFAQFINPILWTVPHALLGLAPDASTSQRIQLTAFNGYVESPTKPMTVAQIRLSHPAFQCTSGELIVMTQLRGIRYLMYYWWLPTAVLAICNISFFEALVLLVVAVLSAQQQVVNPEDSDEYIREDKMSCRGRNDDDPRPPMMMTETNDTSEKQPRSAFAARSETQTHERSSCTTTLFENDNYALRYRTPTTSRSS